MWLVCTSMQHEHERRWGCTKYMCMSVISDKLHQISRLLMNLGPGSQKCSTRGACQQELPAIAGPNITTVECLWYSCSVWRSDMVSPAVKYVQQSIMHNYRACCCMSSCSGLHTICLYTDIGTCLQHHCGLPAWYQRIVCLIEGLGKCNLVVLHAITEYN